MDYFAGSVLKIAGALVVSLSFIQVNRFFLSNIRRLRSIFQMLTFGICSLAFQYTLETNF